MRSFILLTHKSIAALGDMRVTNLNDDDSTKVAASVDGVQARQCLLPFIASANST